MVGFAAEDMSAINESQGQLDIKIARNAFVIYM
jgi:hypothetical protein